MIELKQHAGINLATGAEENLSQDRIFVDGRHVGYVGHRTGDYVQLIRDVSEAERKEIDAIVVAKFNRDAPFTGPPMDIPPEVIDALEGEDDDSE